MTLPTIHADIPNYSDSQREPILVVLLGKIFSDKSTREEAVRMTDARSRFVLAGNNHLWPCYVFPEDVEEDVFGNSGVSAIDHE